jgi:hypothetical protein
MACNASNGDLIVDMLRQIQTGPIQCPPENDIVCFDLDP